MGIDLQRLIDSTQIKGITVEIEYPEIPGFEVEIAFVGKQHMIKIVESCTKRTWNREERRIEEELDRKKVAEHWANNVVLSWKGLTCTGFKKLYPIDVPEDKKNALVESTVENRIAVLWNCADFENWVLAIATSPEYFKDVRKRTEKEIKDLGKQ